MAPKPKSPWVISTITIALDQLLSFLFIWIGPPMTFKNPKLLTNIGAWRLIESHWELQQSNFLQYPPGLIDWLDWLAYSFALPAFMPGLNQTTQKNPCWLKTTKLLYHHYRLLLVEGVDTLLTVLQCQAPADSVLQLIHINIISGPRLLAGGPSGLLHFVLRALRPLMPCDSFNGAVIG